MKWLRRRQSPTERVPEPSFEAPSDIVEIASECIVDRSADPRYSYPVVRDIDPRLADVEQRLLDYNLPFGRDDDRRAEVVENDMVRTNNFALWLQDNDYEFWPYNYRKMEFAEVFSELLRIHQGPVAELIALRAEHNNLITQCFDAAREGIGVTAILQQQLNEYDDKIQRLQTDLFRVFAIPFMDAGFDPFDLCG